MKSFSFFYFPEFAPEDRNISVTESDEAKAIGFFVIVVSSVIGLAIVIIDIPSIYRDVLSALRNLALIKGNPAKVSPSCVMEFPQPQEDVVSLCGLVLAEQMMLQQEDVMDVSLPGSVNGEEHINIIVSLN